jgi:hypothetical protein
MEVRGVVGPVEGIFAEKAEACGCGRHFHRDIKNDTWQLSEILRTLIVNIDNVRGGKVAYKTVTFIGFVGLITGVRPVGCFT